ncbi:MAG: hypothetical protein IPP14_15905 [Planctomycetes bacterium]|nr:hypothetical protein [Planctomycetota bacterium]
MDSASILSPPARAHKPLRKMTALALVILVLALGVGWWQRQSAPPPKPVVISSKEKLRPEQIQFREILGRPAGAPAGFECVQTYDVRPLDETERFSESFVLNFFEGAGETGLVVAQLKDGRWIPLDQSSPPHKEVTASVEVQQGGTYSLGRFTSP